jgi:hypothetical protein
MLMVRIVMHYFGEKNTYNYLTDRFNDGFFNFLMGGVIGSVVLFTALMQSIIATAIKAT